MRFLMIAAAATLLLLPAVQQANACGAKHSAQAAATDLSAAKKKKAVKGPKIITATKIKDSNADMVAGTWIFLLRSR